MTTAGRGRLGTQVWCSFRDQGVPEMAAVAAADLVREGFVRVVNHSAQAGEIAIEEIDDAGRRAAPVALALAANETAHFNSNGDDRAHSLVGVRRRPFQPLDVRAYATASRRGRELKRRFVALIARETRTLR